MNVSDKIIRFCENLESPNNLPDEVIVMNPYQNENTRLYARQFYNKYYNDKEARTVLFGINPGRLGGGITGVPFTDPIRLEEDCGLQNSLEKKQELSSRFIYEMIMTYGSPHSFYNKFYITGVSPLGFVKNGKNLNYYDIPNFKELFEKYALNQIKEQMNFSLNTSIAYSIGQGQNLKFLKFLNEKHKLFERIEALPHPRWIMQYRLKRKDEFIQEYLNKLS